MCQLKIKRENVLHVETVSFKEQMSTKDRKRERKTERERERESWILLVLHKEQVCQLNIKRKRKLWKLLVLQRDQMCQLKIKFKRENKLWE